MPPLTLPDLLCHWSAKMTIVCRQSGSSSHFTFKASSTHQGEGKKKGISHKKENVTADLNYSQTKPPIATHHTCTYSLLSWLILGGLCLVFFFGWLNLVWISFFRGSVGFFSLRVFFGKQLTLPQAPCQQQDPACSYHSATHTVWVHPAQSKGSYIS